MLWQSQTDKDMDRTNYSTIVDIKTADTRGGSRKFGPGVGPNRFGVAPASQKGASRGLTSGW